MCVHICLYFKEEIKATKRIKQGRDENYLWSGGGRWRKQNRREKVERWVEVYTYFLPIFILKNFQVHRKTERTMSNNRPSSRLNNCYQFCHILLSFPNTHGPFFFSQNHPKLKFRHHVIPKYFSTYLLTDNLLHTYKLLS